MRNFIGMSATMFALAFAGEGSAQLLSRRDCQTTWQGQMIRGVVQVEWLPYSQTRRIRGQFHDPQANLIEFEVDTNQSGGVGGMWFNHARHREVHVQLVPLNDRMFDIYGPAGAARYVCR